MLKGIFIKDSIILFLSLMILFKSLENFGNIFILFCILRTQWRISFKRIWVFWIILMRIVIFFRFNWRLMRSLSIKEDVVIMMVLINAINNFVELMWRILFKIRNFFHRGRFWIEDDLLLIWLILIDGSEIETRCRKYGFMGVKNHFFDERFFLGRVEVSLFSFNSFRLHDFWERNNNNNL